MRGVSNIATIFVATLLISLSSADSFGQGVVVIPDSGQIKVPVMSMKGRAFSEVVRQNYDFSCGSAAAATLLTYHYDNAVSERVVLVEMFKTSENLPVVRAKVKKEGFSMLDIKNFLNAKGYQAGGYRLNVDQLEKLNVPAIVLINTKGFKHFVVVKGIRNGQVLIGDPALGIRSLSRDDFEEQWFGPTVLIRDKLELARASYNRDRSWALRPNAPTDAAVDPDSLQSFFITLPSQSDF